ncbi:pyridine nucleotide-disulfide oxidoreductase [Acrocarpospora phusangensis]|uniref:Pyridine nucleotide-disulfide oxidoreductase n=1 Tax=Acrocarpospora phusangensis TaxID=1070424 RepID=A0A919QFZ4_9ACTN|nr:FAD-dependent oxidoreductase [Acrocarpospora phusangensis]GIH28252.1 pyridine nucleotide-disulfide oxidoreductase [Acrocarpospora phusangensis]
MSDNETQFVIIGGGLAGAKAAETLRAERFDGPLTIIAAEQERPYERPPLSKGYLQGASELNEVYVHEEGWYREHDVDLRLGVAATRVAPGERVVELANGERVPYRKLLIATGATPRPLPVDGADLDGVHYLRTLADSQALRAGFGHGGDVVIIGAGWIGLETAAAARKAGCRVVVVEPEPTPLHRTLGRQLGEVFADLHRRNGVTFRFGATVTRLRGEGGQVREVVLDDGQALPADDVVVGIGATPNVELARAAGLEVRSGIVVDETLRSADPDIYAAGDVAEHAHPLLGRHIRVEHWANALNQGPAAARAMLGLPGRYDLLPYFYTDQYELGMEFSGDIEGHDQVVIRGADLEFIAFWLREGHVIAGMNVNVWDVVDDIQALIRSGRQVDPAELADPETPF